MSGRGARRRNINIRPRLVLPTTTRSFPTRMTYYTKLKVAGTYPVQMLLCSSFSRADSPALLQS